MKNSLLTGIFILYTITVSVQAAIRYVPSQYSTIQSAIDACNNGDTIIISDGIYVGAGNRDIDFKGKAITLRSQNGPENCIIDCQGTVSEPHRGFKFHSGENLSSVLNGLSITGGYGPPESFGSVPSSKGGAIYCLSYSSPKIINCNIYNNRVGGTIYSDGAAVSCFRSDPIIENCYISNNIANGTSGSDGGGIYCYISSPTIVNCTITNNTVNKRYGGGISITYHSNPHITNCIIKNNYAYYGGGLITGSWSAPIIQNCFIVQNSAHRGGAIYAGFNSCAATIKNCTITNNMAEYAGGIYFNPYLGSLTLQNCIIWNNDSQEILSTDDSVLVVKYSDISGSWPGIGNINADPMFRNPALGDYHLTGNSPCINTGDFTGDYTGQIDIDGEPRVLNGRVDIGADEYSGGSLPPEPPPPPQTAKVAYHSYTKYSIDSDDPWDSRLYLLDLTTQNGDWVSDNWGTVDNPMNPHFSKDGNQIVFMAVPKGQHSYYSLEIYVWTIGDEEPDRLTYNNDADEDPKFCPDGRIVFKRAGRIYIMNSDGTGARRLTDNSFEESMPFQTKDGTNRILYSAHACPNSSIRIVSEDDKNDKLVVDMPKCQEYYPIAWYDDTFLYTRWEVEWKGTNCKSEPTPSDQIYYCDISDKNPLPLSLINDDDKDDGKDNSDPYPMNRDYILFTSTRDYHKEGYNIYIGNVHTGDAWPIDLYGGENTDKWELGATCWPENISSEILIKLESHADLHVYDPEGRHTGFDYITNTVEESIPGSDFKILDEDGNEVPYDGHTPGEGLRQAISLPELEAGTYKIEIVGTSDGPFRITVSGVQDGYTMTSQSYEGNIDKGVRLSTNIEMVSVLEALTLIWEGQFALQLEPVVDFEPDTLNLGSRGRFVTAFIELPKGFDVGDIDVASLMINGSVRALSKPSEVGDYDEDWVPDLMSKFDYQQIVQVLEPGTQMVVLTGVLKDETPLAGFDFVRVIGSVRVEATEMEKFNSYITEYQQPTTDDSINIGGEDAFDVKECVGFMLYDFSEIINEIDPESFISVESAFELKCTINEVFTMLDEGMYLESLILLEGDILERMDGCANIGLPDEDDCITSIEGQALLYPLVIEITELLESML